MVNYHISGFNGSTTRFTAAFQAGTYNSFLGGTTRFKQPSLHSAGNYFCNRASVEVYQLFIKFFFVVRSTLLHTKCQFCPRRAKDCHILVYIYSLYVSKSNRLLHLIEYEDGGHLLKHAEKTNLA